MSEELRDYIRNNPPKGFKPIPVVSMQGEQIRWYWDDESSYAESVHHDGKWVGTIHRAMSDKRVVGVTMFVEAISGMSSLLDVHSEETA